MTSPRDGSFDALKWLSVPPTSQTDVLERVLAQVPLQVIIYLKNTLNTKQAKLDSY